ncbi:MAG: DUF92 domain-containing protein [bacterium]
MADQLLTGIIFAAIVSAFSYLGRLLTLSGTAVQFILGTLLFGFGSWQWTVPMVTFFVLSSAISHTGNPRKSSANSFFQKSSQRDAGQVAANGGVAGFILLLWLLMRDPNLYVAYLGAVAAATADTWETEIGTLSPTRPVLITTLKPVEAGRSGGVTALGVVAGLSGALSIYLSGLFWLKDMWVSFVAVILGGFAGSVLDSFIGATMQAQFRCVPCGKLTERRIHCGQVGELTQGRKNIGNDFVNLFAIIFGAAVSYAVVTLLR